MSVEADFLGITDHEIINYCTRKKVVIAFLSEGATDLKAESGILHLLRSYFLMDYDSLPLSRKIGQTSSNENLKDSYQLLNVTLEFMTLPSSKVPFYRLNGVYNMLRAVIQACEDGDDKTKLIHVQTLIDAVYSKRNESNQLDSKAIQE